ncbi:uncharacterized protein Dana_GF11607 [Drosophila ananassae]|uniref:Uncharacterized protein n=1 Tax=Drosophila ananassae TaxID=7217 RepID=B3MJ23_DROAN|nr:uncharacterized protein LOC6494471 [Drosophila ananassae]EDV37089.1 uncharacterized protein Dana_GF11607 [Drosophila ananassae]
MNNTKIQLFVFLSMMYLSVIYCSGDQSRHRLYQQSDEAIATISNQLVSQAIELVDSVVEDLLVLDSKNPIILGYLDRFDAFTAVNETKTEEKLNAFYDVVEDYLDSDTKGDPVELSSIESQLISLCLERNGFDRWKRTVQTRTTQLNRVIYRKLKRHMDTLDNEDRLAVERRWKRTLSRGGPPRLEKLRDFVQWLGKFTD